MSASERMELVRFKNIDDFKKLHNSINIHEPEFFYQNPLIDSYFDWSIVKSHPLIYHDRLPWLNKIVYLELDFEKYGHWLKNSMIHLLELGLIYTDDKTSLYQMPQEQRSEEIKIKSLPITITMSMTKILEGVDGFVDEYLTICNALELTAEIDCSIFYYNEWRQLRVNSFL
jgi:hypothetical protein